MRRILLLSSILVLSAAFAFAQYDPPSSGSTQGSTTTATTSTSESSNTTLQGCLAGSEGNYNLTDKSGHTFQLTGNTSGLRAHVGHTIELTGSPSNASATATSSGQPGAMSSTSQSTFNVSSFKHVGTTCDSSQH